MADFEEIGWFLLESRIYASLKSGHRQAVNKWLNDTLGWPDMGGIIKSLYVRIDGKQVRVAFFDEANGDVAEFADIRRETAKTYKVTVTVGKSGLPFPVKVFYSSNGERMFPIFGGTGG